MWLIATDVTRSMVCVSVCVGHTRWPCKNGWTDQDAIWGLTRSGPKNLVLDGVEISTGRGNLGFFGPLNTTGSLLCVCSKNDHLVINNDITANCMAPEWLVLCPPWKIFPLPLMWLFVKYFWPVVVYTMVSHHSGYWALVPRVNLGAVSKWVSV